MQHNFIIGCRMWHVACNINSALQAIQNNKTLIKNARVEVNCWLSYFTCHNFRVAATAATAICGWLHATRDAVDAVAAANELLSVQGVCACAIAIISAATYSVCYIFMYVYAKTTTKLSIAT